MKTSERTWWIWIQTPFASDAGGSPSLWTSSNSSCSPSLCCSMTTWQTQASPSHHPSPSLPRCAPLPSLPRHAPLPSSRTPDISDCIAPNTSDLHGLCDYNGLSVSSFLIPLLFHTTTTLNSIFHTLSFKGKEKVRMLIEKGMMGNNIAF